MLQTFIDARYKDGRPMTDDEITGGICVSCWCLFAVDAPAFTGSLHSCLPEFSCLRSPAGMLIAVLFAGQHTSSITSTWTGLYMIDNPDVGLKPALEEQKAILKEYGDTLDMEVRRPHRLQLRPT